MKKTSLFLAGAMALGLAACSSEEPGFNPETSGSNGDLYTTLTLDFATRSQTDGPGSSTDGVEVGYLDENNVDRILVVLAQYDNTTNKYNRVTHALARAIYNTNSDYDPEKNTGKPKYVVRFETQDLYELAGGDYEDGHTEEPGAKLYVFTYCNPTQSMISEFESFGADGKWTGSFDVDGVYTNGTGAESIWTKNAFLMTNVNTETINLPCKWDLYNVYNKETTPFNLGTITVQRVATRFDFAEKAADAEKSLNANQHAITNPTNGNTDALITVDAVTFFNEAKNYYAYMHTSKDGSNDGWTLCGKDNIGSYVVSPYFETTSSLRGNSAFNYSMVDASNNLIGPGTYTYTLFTDIVKNREDNWTGNLKDREYHIWKYSTPNTIPGIDNQIKGNTTGAIFRAYIEAHPSNTALQTAMEAGHDIYAYEGVMFGDAQMLAKYVNSHPESGVKDAFVANFDFTDGEGDLIVDLSKDVTLKDGVNPAKPASGASYSGFNVYKQDTASKKYYCYYYYYNRHNDNLNPAVMGEMEFAAVRNNVYKLYVNSILQYGHPGDPNDDFTPEDPEDPDETPQTFFKVEVEVIPWVVRVNDIDF